MRSTSRRLLILTGFVLGLLPFTGTLSAQDEQYKFNLDFGYRWTPLLRGSRDLYRSQLDYGEGPRIFSGEFQLSNPQGQNQLFDRLQMKLNGFGGEPYATRSIRVSKAKVYELRWDFQDTQYFSSIPRFANPLFEQGVVQSQHVFDIGQRYSTLELRFMPGRTITPYLAWERSDRHGPVRTTLTAGQDEFVIGSLYDTYANDFRGGINLNVTNFSLLLEQGVRYYREKTDLSFSGLQPGNSLRPIFGRDIVLNDYGADNDSTASIPFSNAVATWHPLESILLRANMSYSMANLDPHFSDTLAGNFFSFPLSAFFTGQSQQVFGEVKKPSFYGDFSAEWQPFDRFRIVDNVKTYRFHVSGSALSNFVFLQFEPVLENGIRDQFTQLSSLNSFLSFRNLSQEIQGMFYVTPRLLARLGHRYEHREVEVEQAVRYDRNVLIAGLSYDFAPRNRISAEYEYGHTERPIMRTDIVDFQRVRLRGRFSPFSTLDFEGSATLFDNENDDIQTIDFTSRDRSYSAQFNYVPSRRVSLSGGYERSSIRTSILYIIPQTFTLDRSRYREKGNFGNAYVNLLLIRNASLSLGYAGWGVSGDFPLNHHRPSARLEIPIHERVSFYGQWNYFDYNEKVRFLPQDYRAHLTMFGFRINLNRP